LISVKVAAHLVMDDPEDSDDCYYCVKMPVVVKPVQPTPFAVLEAAAAEYNLTSADLFASMGLDRDSFLRETTSMQPSDLVGLAAQLASAVAEDRAKLATRSAADAVFAAALHANGTDNDGDGDDEEFEPAPGPGAIDLDSLDDLTILSSKATKAQAVDPEPVDLENFDDELGFNLSEVEVHLLKAKKEAQAAVAASLAPPTAAPSGAVVAVDGAGMNSSTHHTEWMAFNRKLKSDRNLPCVVRDEETKDKQTLFSMWMSNGKDFNQCEAIIKRKLTKKQEQTAMFGYRKQRDIELMYPKEKAEAMVKARRAACKTWKDPEFPDDKDEDFFWVRVAVDVKHSMAIEDSIAAKE
jgi:hypothetical protein